MNFINKTSFLHKPGVSSPGNIKYFKADRLQDRSYREAAKESEHFFCTASLFPCAVNGPKHDSADPELAGIKNVLNRGSRTEYVTLAVLTGCTASIFKKEEDHHSIYSETATFVTGNTSLLAEDRSSAYEGNDLSVLPSRRVFQCSDAGRKMISRNDVHRQDREKSKQNLSKTHRSAGDLIIEFLKQTADAGSFRNQSSTDGCR